MQSKGKDHESILEDKYKYITSLPTDRWGNNAIVDTVETYDVEAVKRVYPFIDKRVDNFSDVLRTIINDLVAISNKHSDISAKLISHILVEAVEYFNFINQDGTEIYRPLMEINN